MASAEGELVSVQAGEIENTSHTWHRDRKVLFVVQGARRLRLQQNPVSCSHTLGQGAGKGPAAHPNPCPAPFSPLFYPHRITLLFFPSPSLHPRLGLLSPLLALVFILAHLGGIYIRKMRTTGKSRARLHAETVARATFWAGVVMPISKMGGGGGLLKWKPSSPIPGLYSSKFQRTENKFVPRGPLVFRASPPPYVSQGPIHTGPTTGRDQSPAQKDPKFGLSAGLPGGRSQPRCPLLGARGRPWSLEDNFHQIKSAFSFFSPLQ